MKAISIRQPWAQLVIEGIKDIENRNWFTKYRGKLYIHAAKTFERDAAEQLLISHPHLKQIIFDSTKLLGCVIGHVEMKNCVQFHPSEWFQGKYGFVLQGPKKMKPYYIKGKLNIFDFDTKRIEKQLSLF
jgi:ASCH domain-containing protein